MSSNIHEEHGLFLYKLKDFSALQSSTLFPLTLYCYKKKTRLITGQCFGEFALNDPYCRRTASIISNTTCHLGTFTKTNYVNFIKEAVDRSRKLYMLFILSLHVFKRLSLVELQKRYFTNFIVHKIEKNSFAIKENESMQCIYLFKEGTYEHTINTSLFNITDIINKLFDKGKSLMNNNIISTSKAYDKIKSSFVGLNEDIQHMKKENETFYDIAMDVPLLRKFYYEKIVFKIYTSDTHELLGFDDLCLKNNESIFSVKCVSPMGEYLVLNKCTYNDISENNSDILKGEKEYCYMRINKTIKRLLDIRKSKIQTFIDQHKINNILNLKGYIDPHQPSEHMQTINTNSQSNSGRKSITINKKKFNLLLNSTKSLISSPLLMQNFMSSVKAIKHNKHFYTNNRFFSSSTVNNTLNNSSRALFPKNLKTQTKNGHLTLSANRKRDDSNHNSSPKIHCASLSITTKSRISSSPVINHSSTKTFRHPLSRQHTNLLLPSQDSVFNLTNKKKFQLTKHGVFTQQQRQTQLNHFQTNHSSANTCSIRKTNVANYKSNKTIHKMCSHYVQVPSLPNDVNGINNHKTKASSSSDAVANNNKKEEMNCVGDYEIIKKEKYIEKRKVYLMKHTRDFFLRYTNKIKMKKRKKKL